MNFWLRGHMDCQGHTFSILLALPRFGVILDNTAQADRQSPYMAWRLVCKRSITSTRVMSTISFKGTVRSGKGKHNQMVVPGRTALASPPDGWPESFWPGSLNVGILPDGYPHGFQDPDTGGTGVVQLDDGNRTPALVLEWNQIENNGLQPKPDKPRRGTGQFWRAVLTVVSTGQTRPCWVFRRINSTIKRQLEIIADCSLRDVLSLTDGTQVYVHLSGSNTNGVNRTQP